VFDTKPESTRSYISFQQGQRVVIQRRHDCGWWIGSVIENERLGNLSPKGYFPGTYTLSLLVEGDTGTPIQEGKGKKMLGEKLYPAVSRLEPELAGKITGMLLEMDNTEILTILESETQLRQKVDEAVRVLDGLQLL